MGTASTQLLLNVLCRMSTPTANMDFDQPNAEARAAKARLAVSGIMRVPLEVATGPTCTPQGGRPIRARFTFTCAMSGRGGTLFSCKYCCNSKKYGGWAGHLAKMVVHLTGQGKGGKYFNDQRAGAGCLEEEDIRPGNPDHSENGSTCLV